MGSKQKKLNRMTDMSGLAPKLSDKHFSDLQQRHLIRQEIAIPSQPAVLSQLIASAENSSASRRIVPFSFPKPVISARKASTRSPGRYIKTIHIFDSLAAASKTAKKFLKPIRFKTAASASALPALAFFLGLNILGISLIPLLQSLENNRQTGSRVLGVATSAYDSLQSARESLLLSDFQGANENLRTALRGFSQALSDMEQLNAAANLFPQTATGEKLLLAARDATLALQSLSAGMEGLLEVRATPTGLRLATRSSDLVAHIHDISENLQTAARYVANVRESLREVVISDLPGSLQPKVNSIADTLNIISPGLQSLITLQQVLGAYISQTPKTFLVLFQNNRELRATGGFIGTYGVFSLVAGGIHDMKIESIYNPDGQLKEKIAAPGPLQQQLTSHWAMRDSNWFFDFPRSARKAAEFFSLETGLSADEVIAFTPRLFQRMLELTGPIDMPEYRTQLTSENFVDEVQYQTSEIYDRRLNQPKKFLADLAPVLLARLQNLPQERWIELLEATIGSLESKDMQLYSSDSEQQQRFESLGWSGSVRATAGDYLAVVHSNVGGGKTNQQIDESVRLSVRIGPDGTQTNRVSILRSHRPGEEKEFPVNVDFMRVYVPVGSRLVSATGFDSAPFLPSALPDAKTDPDLKALDDTARIDPNTGTIIYAESGKTVFANWLKLPPGESREVTLEYTLPVTYSIQSHVSAYRLLVQKQSGGFATRFSASLDLAENFRPLWQSGPTGGDLENPALPEQSLVADTGWGVVFEHR